MWSIFLRLISNLLARKRRKRKALRDSSGNIINQNYSKKASLKKIQRRTSEMVAILIKDKYTIEQCKDALKTRKVTYVNDENQTINRRLSETDINGIYLYIEMTRQ